MSVDCATCLVISWMDADNSSVAPATASTFVDVCPVAAEAAEA